MEFFVIKYGVVSAYRKFIVKFEMKISLKISGCLSKTDFCIELKIG